MSDTKTTFHSGEEFPLEAGGLCLVTSYALESGALRTALTLPDGALLSDRDCAVIAGRLLARSHAPEERDP